MSETSNTDVTSRAGITYLSEVREFTSVFSELCVPHTLFFNTVSLFVLLSIFCLSILLSALQMSALNYPLGILKRF